MCTFAETSDVRILLDAGVSVCPYRFGLPPHPLEFRAIDECRRRIAQFAEKAEVITLSHYHFDHHTPSFQDWLCNWTEADETARQIYQGKTVLVKNPKEAINDSQRRRAWLFQQTAGKHVKKLEVADGNSFIFGETRLRFSVPVFHGAAYSYLGWVLMLIIECQDEKLMFAPDVQGPIDQNALKIIMDEKPQVLMIGGPPLYLAGFKVDEAQIQTALTNMERIAAAVPLVILEHHLLRDENWREKTKTVFDKAKKTGGSILTAAEFLGEHDQCLEATRKRLFAESPPSGEFKKWMRLNEEAKKREKPPL
jgi:hypothetical protein